MAEEKRATKAVEEQEAQDTALETVEAETVDEENVIKLTKPLNGRRINRKTLTRSPRNS